MYCSISPWVENTLLIGWQMTSCPAPEGPAMHWLWMKPVGSGACQLGLPYLKVITPVAVSSFISNSTAPGAVWNGPLEGGSVRVITGPQRTTSSPGPPPAAGTYLKITSEALR